MRVLAMSPVASDSQSELVRERREWSQLSEGLGDLSIVV